MSAEMTTLTKPVTEGTTRVLTGIIKDAVGVPLSVALIEELTVLLYAKGTNQAVAKDANGNPLPAAVIERLTAKAYEAGSIEVINGRDHQDILGANGGEVGTDGVWTLELSPEDNVILNTGGTREEHFALIEWTYQGGKKGKHLIVFPVTNLYGVPA